MKYSNSILRTQACSAACYHEPVFVDKWVRRQSAASVGAVSTLFYRDRPHFDFITLGVQIATIRVRHQGLFHETRRDRDIAIRTSSHTQSFLDPACAVISFRIMT